MRQLAKVTLLVFTACAALNNASAMERVSLKRGESRIHVTGKVMVEAEDGGLLLLATDGRLWIIQPGEITQRKKDEGEFRHDDAATLSRKLIREMPKGFRIHRTAHYVICYNTSPAYAQWCGALYERLYRGFFQYWKNRGFKLKEPEAPLIALVFSDRMSYEAYSRRELGGATQSIIGYYNMRTNRVNMYDLTGTEELRLPKRIRSADRINRVLSQPAAERTVATIVHEATHQLSYNSGLQTRYADNPFWVSEGLAVYFETPDLKSSKGWRSIGGVNRYNLLKFRQSLKTRPADSLQQLVQSDKLFRDKDKAAAAYSEAWALNYFLFRTKSKSYVEYLKLLSAKRPLDETDPAARLMEFQRFFGHDLEELDGEFLRYMRRVR